ncbi:hypothetical protein VD0004_g842 [Verticillium dahliae]|nr:hypothetical protein VD0004_g842 [Verticillium dahliae]PNH71235.1 hypothetical protein VD0001_g6329 [Verticillium dahliae]
MILALVRKVLRNMKPPCMVLHMSRKALPTKKPSNVTSRLVTAIKTSYFQAAFLPVMN